MERPAPSDCAVVASAPAPLSETSAADDVHLAARFLRGDPQAGVDFAHRLGFVRTFLAARNGRLGPAWREADLDDLAQETCVRAIANLDRFEGRARLETWFARIAVLVALEAQRARERVPAGPATSSGVRRETEDHGTPCGLHRMADAPRPRRRPTDSTPTHMGAELREQVASAMTSLPSAERQVVDLHVRRELTFEQVGAALGIPPGTAKTRYYRALETLRTRLGAARRRN